VELKRQQEAVLGDLAVDRQEWLDSIDYIHREFGVWGMTGPQNRHDLSFDSSSQKR
jgi:hypothetical protein